MDGLLTTIDIATTKATAKTQVESARLAYDLSENSLLWSAVSRAVRTPARFDRDLNAAGILERATGFVARHAMVMRNEDEDGRVCIPGAVRRERRVITARESTALSSAR